MKKYNYDRTAQQVLLDSYRKQNRGKNRLLLLAVTLTVSVIYCILSFAYGKIQTDIQKNIRADGMAVSVYIENGTEEMAEQLKSLPYIAKTGKEKFAGKLLDQNIKYCDCVAADETGFQEMLSPAYTQIVGSYPEQENDIMLSAKTLEYLGISEPQIGMELDLDFYWNDIFRSDGTGEQAFHLSGYFTDYQNASAASSIAFLSEKKLTENGINWDSCRVLLDTQSHGLSGIQIENKLKEDVRLTEDQRIVSTDSAFYRAVEGMMGSLGFAVVFSFLILLCMFLCVYNILNLSLAEDLRQYGLLEVIGVQQKQIIKVMFRQMLEIAAKGSFTGGMAGVLAVLVILPLVIKKMYLEQASELERLSLFHPVFLLIAMVPAAVTICLAVFFVKRKISHLSPLECLNYEEIPLTKGQEKAHKMKSLKSHRRHPEIYLARKYLFRSRKAFFITIISLTIGCGIALASSVIVRGVDIQNRFLKEPDFRIGITQEACQTLMETSPDTENMVFFSKDLLEDIEWTAGNSMGNESQLLGFYPIIGTNGRESIKLLSNGEEAATVVQTITSVEKKKLQAYIQKQEQRADWETFEYENGTFLLHDHRLSETVAENAMQQVGKEIEVYDLVPVGTEMSGQVPETLVNCGYLDITEEQFPDLNLCWDGRNTNILLVTEDTYGKLAKKLTPQTFAVSFDVEGKQENSIKSRLKDLIQKKNMEFQAETGYSDKLNLLQVECKSDLLVKEQNYIQTSRLLLLVISGCLIFIGILNFLNVRVADMILRKKDCSIMRSIGMTKKQLQKMFLAEGLLTWLVLFTFLTTIGSILIRGVGWFMKTKISYFVFYYPIKEMAGILLVLLGICITIPRFLYKQTIEQDK